MPVIHQQHQHQQHQQHQHQQQLHSSDTDHIRRPSENCVVVAKREISPSDLTRNGRQFVHSVPLGETLARGGKCGNQTLPKSIKNHSSSSSCISSSSPPPRNTSPNTVDI
ncbi:hypothetical protein Pmani_005059 [Petrolisthes manimaculis]|uniref:Uncharacterized protein n=1 Tax=Petrolisthes manimaculis TaxID=1843537 RepID=A0AAE1QCA6_9EUCA|nr:hypothetical protein Pmani_005059 [Petrolisthes manimaculis]